MVKIQNRLEEHYFGRASLDGCYRHPLKFFKAKRFFIMILFEKEYN